MKIIISFNFIFIFLIIPYPSLSLKKKKSKSNVIIGNKKFEISSILNWAKINNIYIHQDLVLNKNIDASHNFYYFTSNSSISNNTVLMRVPYDIMISQTLLNNHFHETKKGDSEPVSLSPGSVPCLRLLRCYSAG